MTVGLFAAPQLEGAGGRSGFRLMRLEVLNWGTFDRQVWRLDVGGSTSLLTGDIGSGKSTLVDAITTLLVRADRVAYNKASGADARERSLTSYVRGYYKSERNEETGTSRPVALRPRDTYSVLLAVFGNGDLKSDVTIAQVFWLRSAGSGAPERFFVTADRGLSISEHFAGFGSDISQLRRRLRSVAGVHETFKAYAKDFRRRLGIESEQAMDLFHQTVSLKSVGDLNEFVRGHMLEPFDSADWVRRLVDHFDDLTQAHEAVTRARSQLAALAPLLEDCAAYDTQAAAVVRLDALRAALPVALADRKTRLLTRSLATLAQHVRQLERELEHTGGELQVLNHRKERLAIERAGHGGNRLAEIEAEVRALEQELDRRRARRVLLDNLLAQAQLPPLGEPAQLRQRLETAAAAAQGVEDGYAGLSERRTTVALEQRDLEGRAAEVNAELRSLQARRTNIPSQSEDLRDRLCADLGLDTGALPFAAELLQVRPEHAAWEGAAERVLRSFALSLLVPEESYAAVSQWVNERHLGARVVYFRVPRVVSAVEPRRDGELVLADVVEIRTDTPHYAWLEAELSRRANHVCARTLAEFRRAARAVTREGQVKGGGGRHEKDDRKAISDRTAYVLGWDNGAKVELLLRAAQTLQQQLTAAARRRAGLERDERAMQGRRTALSTLLTSFTDEAEVDHESVVSTIERRRDEHRRISGGSDALRRVEAELETTRGEIDAAEGRRDTLQQQLGETRARVRREKAMLEGAQAVLAGGAGQTLLAEHAADVDRRLGSVDVAEDVDAAGDAVRQALERERDEAAHQQTLARERAVRKMLQFRHDHPLEVHEIDAAIESAGEFRALHERLVADDLPRFEKQFKDYLNTNTIRDIASFSGQLHKQVALIHERISTINDSLVGIDYNRGRYIRLDTHRTTNQEVRQFIADLRACTEGAVGADEGEQYSEAKFVQVKGLIERFRGRDGLAESDRVWTRRVTDVRNWVTFSASERWREDDSEHESYTGSGGKSGGQKEKLAYTILAASLAYQFKLDWGSSRSKTFRFVVIDEAFGRGSDESTRYGLDLFRRLGLQLLVVTPLQKIHVIEPYVEAVGFVDNRTGAASRLQTLTIEEYHERKSAQAGLVRPPVAPGTEGVA